MDDLEKRMAALEAANAKERKELKDSVEAMRLVLAEQTEAMKGLQKMADDNVKTLGEVVGTAKKQNKLVEQMAGRPAAQEDAQKVDSGRQPEAPDPVEAVGEVFVEKGSKKAAPNIAAVEQPGPSGQNIPPKGASGKTKAGTDEPPKDAKKKGPTKKVTPNNDPMKKTPPKKAPPKNDQRKKGPNKDSNKDQPPKDPPKTSRKKGEGQATAMAAIEEVSETAEQGSNVPRFLGKALTMVNGLRAYPMSEKGYIVGAAKTNAIIQFDKKYGAEEVKRCRIANGVALNKYSPTDKLCAAAKDMATNTLVHLLRPMLPHAPLFYMGVMTTVRRSEHTDVATFLSAQAEPAKSVASFTMEMFEMAKAPPETEWKAAEAAVRGCADYFEELRQGHDAPPQQRRID